MDRRQAVAGVKGATFGYVPNQPPPPEGNAKFFERVIEDVRQLLNPTFDALERAGSGDDRVGQCGCRQAELEILEKHLENARRLQMTA